MTCSVFSHTLKPAGLLSAALCEKIIWMSSDGGTFSAALTWICWEGKRQQQLPAEQLWAPSVLQTWGENGDKASLLPPSSSTCHSLSLSSCSKPTHLTLQPSSALIHSPPHPLLLLLSFSLQCLSPALKASQSWDTTTAPCPRRTLAPPVWNGPSFRTMWCSTRAEGSATTATAGTRTASPTPGASSGRAPGPSAGPTATVTRVTGTRKWLHPGTLLTTAIRNILTSVFFNPGQQHILSPVGSRLLKPILYWTFHMFGKQGGLSRWSQHQPEAPRPIVTSQRAWIFWNGLIKAWPRQRNLLLHLLQNSEFAIRCWGSERKLNAEFYNIKHLKICI